jgi:hypothetical protein
MSESSTEDENASELSAEVDQQIQARLADAGLDGPSDPADAFLKDFFAKRKWVQQRKSVSLKSDSDDIEDIDDALEFEKRYNFRHQEPGSSVIESHPRRVEGESRDSETGRHRRRRAEAELEREKTEATQQQLDAIDEKYRLLAEANGGRLTPEQLSQWTDEVSALIIEDQGGKFEYTEIARDGGIERSIKILDGPDEEDSPADAEEEDKRRQPQRSRGGYRTRGGFRARGGGRGGPRGRGGHRRGSHGISTERMDSYFAHRH